MRSLSLLKVTKQNARLVALTAFLLIFCTQSQAFVWGLLARGAVSRAAVSAGARTAAAEAANGSRVLLGRVSRSATATGDLGWVGRQVAKQVIEDAIRARGPVVRELEAASCLLIEFNGKGNYVANYCNDSVVVSNIAQLDEASGEVGFVGCSGCSFQPGELSYFAPFAVTGPFVAVEYQVGGGNSGNVSNNSDVPIVTPSQRNVGSGRLQAVALRSSYNNVEASLVAEIRNDGPFSVGLVVQTQSLFAFAKATIFNNCGGSYGQRSSPYDSFSGVSKDLNAPTWIAPGQTIIVSLRPNTLLNGGPVCPLSHAIIDAYSFRPGVANGQPTPIFIAIN